jgi:signal transduction histidine kinase
VGRRVSHDLRTPLGAALSTSELLREVLSEDAPEHLPLAEAIFDAADEMMHLIERISFVLKAVAAPSARETVDAGWILLGAKERLQIRLQEAQVSIIEPPSWPRVRAAPAWLDAIWTHLLIYALQHACERPRFELGWVREPLQFWLDFPQAPGGPPPDQPVQPFHRLHELSGWMDLGLAIAQRLVELQGGRLTRQSASPGRVRLSFTLEGSPLE